MNCFGTCFTHVQTVMSLVLKVLRNGLLRYILYTLYIRPATWGGVGGWGGVGCNDMHCTCTHIRCYAIVLAHMFDATQLHLRTCRIPHMLDATQLHLRTCSMLRNCTCAHVRCYAIALAHMLDARQLHLRTCSMLRNCTCAHVRCYAIVLAHMFDATQLHLHTSPRSCPKHFSVAYSKWFSKPAR